MTLLGTYYTYYYVSGSNTPLGGDIRYYFQVYLDTQDIVNNRSHIQVRAYAQKVNIYEPTLEYAGVSINGGSYTSSSATIPPNSTGLVGTFNSTINHNSSGVGSFTVQGRGSPISSIYIYTSSNTINLPTIPRGTTVTSFTVSKRDLTSLKIDWESANSVDRLQYSIKKEAGAWSGWQTAIIVSGTSGSFNLTGLDPHTQYTVQIRVRRASSGVWSDSSGHKIQTTYDLSRISSTSPSDNIEMGESFVVNFTNPSGLTTKFSMVDPLSSAGTTQHTAVSPFTFNWSGENSALNDFYQGMANKTETTLSLFLETSGFVSETTRKFKITENSSSKPIFTTWTYKDINPLTVSLTGNNQKIVKNYSNVEATITSGNKMITQKGANPGQYVFTIGGKSETIPYSTSNQSKTINKADNKILSITATDSRSFSQRREKDLGNNFIDYFKPNITEGIAERDNGVSMGTKLTFNGTWWNNSFGLVQNQIKKISYSYARSDGNVKRWEKINNNDAYVWNDDYSTLYIVGDNINNYYNVGDRIAVASDLDELRVFTVVEKNLTNNSLRVNEPIDIWHGTLLFGVYKEEVGSEELEISNFTINGNAFSFDGYIRGDLKASGFDNVYSYTLYLKVEDELDETTYEIVLNSGKPRIAIHQDGVSIGAPYDENIGGVGQIHEQPTHEKHIVNKKYVDDSKGSLHTHSNKSTLDKFSESGGQLKYNVGLGNLGFYFVFCSSTGDVNITGSLQVSGNKITFNGLTLFEWVEDMLKIGEELKNEILDDTGWINVPYKSGITYSSAAAPLQYRIKNGVFYTRGTFKKISGNFTVNAYEEIATFPTTVISRMPNSGYDTVIMVPSGGGREAARGYITTAGVLNIRKSANQDFTYGVLNLTFPLDIIIN